MLNLGEEDQIADKLSPEAREMLKGATSFQLKQYGALDQQTVEGMLVGFMVLLSATDEKAVSLNCEKIVESGIAPSWFTSKELSGLFGDVLSYYKTNRRPMTPENGRMLQLTVSRTQTEAANYSQELISCNATVLARKLDIDPIIDLMVSWHLAKAADRIHEKFIKDRANPAIGIKKAHADLRESILRDVVDTRGASIKAYDFIGDYDENWAWIKDMKLCPEKYRGARCGLTAIDDKTQGFRPGQLTVFVGSHGGFKTTTMLNIAFRLWQKKNNVLYVSLEMEASICQAKFLSVGAGVKYSRAYSGQFTEKDDDARLVAIQKLLDGAALSDAEKSLMSGIKQDRESLVEFQKSISRGKASLNLGEPTDDIKMERFKAEMATAEHHLKIAVIGQSQKMKMSQLERWLIENQTQWKPDVIFLDYLDLIDPENPNPDRPDIGLGDICKMMRAMGKKMGFSVVTAAQLKRSAIERLRKHGLDAPEKASLGTDDISGSAMIGADADNVFVLWRESGGTKVRIFTAKSRYGGADQQGRTLEVNPDLCQLIDPNDCEGTERQCLSATPAMANQAGAAFSQGKRSYVATPEDIDEEPVNTFQAPGLDDDFDDMASDKKEVPEDLTGTVDF